jgi:carnitine 3-dehydrogenase
MSIMAAEDVCTLGVVGTGAIGASWAALGLRHGLRVVAWDPAPDAESRLRHQVGRLLGEPAGLDLIAMVDSLDGVAAAADLVLEGGPERLDVKREIFAVLDAVARPEVLLTSSSSGLRPSEIQTACEAHPERMLVAHPFNPPHLVPLVEVVGGERTSDAAVEAALATFRHLGKQPIRIDREVPGHVANRLQAALWREAYHLVDQGVCSVADIDAAISSGPGLRWALLGPFATQHVSGGPGGLAHVLDHLGPPMVAWWEDLGEPELTPSLVDRLVAGVEDELAGADVAEVTARRDEGLQQLMELKARLDLA